MPFDPMPRETALDRRRRLITALRQQMPDDFVWNFAKWRGQHECGTVGCACGLAVHLGISKSTKIDAMAQAVGLTIDAANRVFYPSEGWQTFRRYGVWTYAQITPAMVAAALERIA